MDGSLTLVLFMFGLCSLPPWSPQHRELAATSSQPLIERKWDQQLPCTERSQGRTSHYSQISLIFYPVLTFLVFRLPEDDEAAGDGVPPAAGPAPGQPRPQQTELQADVYMGRGPRHRLPQR